MDKSLTECRVCGAPDSSSHFGTISCHSCKMFFKRNAERGESALKCCFNDQCEVNINNRHICSLCRLRKCFFRGMKIEMIRSSRTKTIRKEKGKKISKIPKISNENGQFPVLNILQLNQSILTVDQGNLLSNLLQCYDEYNGLLLVERFVSQQTALPLKLRFKYSSVREFLTSLLTKMRLSLEKNADFLALCSHDRSTLLHISTPSTAVFSASFVVRQSRLLNQTGFLQSTENLFGSTTMKRLIDQLAFDPTFIKLVFLILSFSTANYTIYRNTDAINLKNIQTIIRTHDQYTELAWRYLLNKHGYQHAVICFCKLASCLLTLNSILVELYEDKSLTDMIECVLEQTKQTLTHLD